MKKITTLGLLTLALLLSAPASAQPVPPLAPSATPRAGPAGAKLRQQIARRIQLIRMNAIITALGLSPKQAPKFFAVVHQFEKRLKKVRQSNHQIMQQLGQMVRSGKYQAAKINTLAAKLMKNQIQIKQIELKRFQTVRRIITAGQLAKLIIALPRIERRIRRLIRRAQQRRGRGRGWSPNLVGP